MAVFTPKSKFMSMMKTTLDTNKYFMENNMKDEYDENIDFFSKEEDSIEKDMHTTISINNNPKPYSTNEEYPSYDLFNEKYEEFKSFSEQQIKLNKQTKNNFDRLNKKINHNTEIITKNISDSENFLSKRIEDCRSSIDLKLDYAESDINKTISNLINEKASKIITLLSINFYIIMGLFAYLIITSIK